MEEVFRTAYVYVRNVFAGTLCETEDGYSFASVSYTHLVNHIRNVLRMTKGEKIMVSCGKGVEMCIRDRIL